MIRVSLSHGLAGLLFVISLLALAPAAWGAVVTLTDPPQPVQLGNHFQFLDDPTGGLGVEDVTHGMAAIRFRPLARGPAPNIGYSASTIWLTVTLRNDGAEPARILEIPFPTLDEVHVYLYDRGRDRIEARYTTGDRYPFAQRPMTHANFAFPLHLPPGEERELVIQVRSAGSLTVASTLWPEAAFAAHGRAFYNTTSLYLGVLLALLAYNALLYLSLRDRAYLFYVCFVASMAVAQGSWNGYLYEYLWPGWPAWANLSAVTGFDATGLFGALFSRTFLDTRRNAPAVDRVMVACAIVFGLLFVTAPWTPYKLHAMGTSATGLVFSVVAVVGGTLCLLRGFTSARYFLLAWTLLLIGTGLLGARNLDLVPTNFITLHAMQIGSALEVLLLSFALAERINALRHQKESAEAANRAKDDFLATVSHEIRTPLTVLLGNARLLLTEGLLPRQAALANGMRRSGEQLLSLLNDLLDLSRSEAGQLQLERTPFQPQGLAREVFELMEGAARAKGLRLELHAEGLPAWLIGDPGRIRQALLNLVSNAIKFTENGTIAIDVSVASEAPERTTLHWAVSDTGIGIRSADLERLFRPFAQVTPGTPRAAGGTGLGLAITRRLIEAMGGTVGVESDRGLGSNFWFSLPLERVLGAEALPVEWRYRPRPLSVLLVEDVAESREVLTALLRHEGHAVEAVDSGAAALAAALRTRFDVVLLDLHMPLLDGYETVRHLRARPGGRDLPVFAVTANITRRTIEACRKAGIDEVVAKPLDMNDLNAKLVKHFGDSEAEAAAQAPAAPAGPLDVHLLNDRLERLGRDAIEAIFAAYRDAAPGRLRAVTDAWQAGDHQRLRQAAHAMKSAAGAAGLTELFALADTLETAAENETAERLGDLVAQLAAAHGRARESLADWCDQQGLTVLQENPTAAA